VAAGDTVQVLGSGDFTRGGGDAQLVLHPDRFLSATRVAEAFSCERRTVLGELIRDGETGESAVVGKMVHAVFQAMLAERNPTRAFIERATARALAAEAEALVALGLSEEEARGKVRRTPSGGAAAPVESGSVLRNARTDAGDAPQN